MLVAQQWPEQYGQVRAGFVALAGALHEDHGLDFLAVGTLDGAAVGRLGQGFEAGLIDHVGLAAAEFGQLGDVVGREAGGLDDGADGFLGDAAGFLCHLDDEAAGRAGGFGDRRIQMHLDLGVAATLAAISSTPVSCGSA